MDEDPLRQAYDENYLHILRLCVLLAAGNTEEAKDLTQETFVQCASRLTRSDVAVRAYLRQTAINLFRNQYRRMRLASRRTFLDRDSAPTFEEGAVDRDVVWSAVRRLPTRQRACLVLRFYEDLPEQEIATLLRCSVGTVKSQTHRALTKLRRELGDDY